MQSGGEDHPFPLKIRAALGVGGPYFHAPIGIEGADQKLMRPPTMKLFSRS
jgi:hypothetical protein